MEERRARIATIKLGKAQVDTRVEESERVPTTLTREIRELRRQHGKLIETHRQTHQAHTQASAKMLQEFKEDEKEYKDWGEKNYRHSGRWHTPKQGDKPKPPLFQQAAVDEEKAPREELLDSGEECRDNIEQRIREPGMRVRTRKRPSAEIAAQAPQVQKGSPKNSPPTSKVPKPS